MHDQRAHPTQHHPQPHRTPIIPNPSTSPEIERSPELPAEMRLGLTDADALTRIVGAVIHPTHRPQMAAADQDRRRHDFPHTLWGNEDPHQSPRPTSDSVATDPTMSSTAQDAFR